jgi:hypothetical protein
MNRDFDQGDGKKAYEPPQLTTISLRPEEAVLGACKTMNAGGMSAGACSTAFLPCVQNFGS